MGLGGRFSRRDLLAHASVAAVVSAVATMAACSGGTVEVASGAPEPIDPSAGTDPAPSTSGIDRSSTRRDVVRPTSPAGTAGSTGSTAPAVDGVSTAGWVRRENARPGTTAWRITDEADPRTRWKMDGAVEGFAGTTSAQPGDTVDLYVSTSATSWHAEVYRMGWYGGALGRLVWTSDVQAGGLQGGPIIEPATRMHRTDWTSSLEIRIGDDWPSGSYLIKLVASSGRSSYVPLTVRRDDAIGGLVVVNAVTTWQAYNPWGGRSLYESFLPGSRSDRSTVVSFDRPYALSYSWGAADFLTHELPLIALIEELGIDTVHVTDIDLHTSSVTPLPEGTPPLLRERTAVLTTGHDEYYSWEMRHTLERARELGVNLAFFGANAVYRSIRLEPNDEGRPARQMVNHRVESADPVSDLDPTRSTVQWRNAPLRRPENELIGIQYVAAGVTADMVIVRPDNWMFDGVPVTGNRLRRLVAIEADALGPASSEPPTLEVVASSPARGGGRRFHHAMTYYTAPSGAGIVATGTIAWAMALDAASWDDPAVTGAVRGITANILRAFADGPAGVQHPSTPNASRYRREITAD